MGLVQDLCLSFGLFTHSATPEKSFLGLADFGLNDARSFVSGSRLYSFNLLNNDFFRLVVVDVDLPWDDVKVINFLNYLFENYQLRAYAEKSLGGRIHFLIPFNFGIKYDDNLIFLKFIEEVSKSFWGNDVEVFPNGRSITLVLDYIYGRKGLLFVNDSFKKRLGFIYRFFKKPFANTRTVFDFIKNEYGNFFSVNQYLFSALSGKDAVKLEVAESGEDLDFVISRIVNEIKDKDYVKGKRNDLIFELSGFLAFLGKSKAEIEKILSPLIEIDEERKKRIELIGRAVIRRQKGEALYFKRLITMFPHLGKFILKRRIELQGVGNTFLNNVLLKIKDNKVLRLADLIAKRANKYGSRVVLGYNSLSSSLKMSKRDISFALKTLCELGFLKRIVKGRFFMLEDEKVSVGSIYEIGTLDEVPFVYRASEGIKKVLDSFREKASFVAEFYLSRTEFEEIAKNKFLLLPKSFNSVKV